jgi:hypothetical protein
MGIWHLGQSRRSVSLIEERSRGAGWISVMTFPLNQAGAQHSQSPVEASGEAAINTVYTRYVRYATLKFLIKPIVKHASTENWQRLSEKPEIDTEILANQYDASDPNEEAAPGLKVRRSL